MISRAEILLRNSKGIFWIRKTNYSKFLKKILEVAKNLKKFENSKQLKKIIGFEKILRKFPKQAA